MKWYRYDIRNLKDVECEKYYSLMSVNKQKRVDRFRFVNDKKRTVAGEMLARKTIAEWCNVSEEAILFDKSESGKPFAVGLDVEFNISHSEDIVVCAVDDKPVGIDVEKIRPIDLNIAKHICTDEELAYIWSYKARKENYHQTCDNGVLARFFEIWTSKEAYGKFVGTGVARIPIRQVVNRCSIVKSIFEDYVVTICVDKSRIYK